MTALVVSAHASDLNGSDWAFAYQGHYSLVGADSWSLSRSPQAVPEPATVAALGVGALGVLRRRRKA